jgi:chorismate dehydratase
MTELGGARIAVTGETATSVRLLRVLLAFRDEAAPPILVRLDEPADAVLLIGDAALRAWRGPWPHPYCADLGEEWTGWTGLPCVFAAWAVRSDVGAVARDALRAVLESALAQGLRDLPAIARARHDLGLSEAEIVAYLRTFSYRLGSEEEKAIAEFRRLLGLLEDFGGEPRPPPTALAAQPRRAPSGERIGPASPQGGETVPEQP